MVSYCIMNNHAHMLLYTNDILNVSKFMRSVNTSYAAYYNKSEERVGYVFRDRFISEPINTKSYLHNCIAYIHNNPVKANIVTNVYDYMYSSYRDYLNKTGTITEEIIKLVFDTDKEYIDTYIQMHKSNQLFKDIENKYLDYNDVIKDFKQCVDMNLNEIKHNKELLKDLICKLINDSGLSVRKISKVLSIDRNKIRRIMR